MALSKLSRSVKDKVVIVTGAASGMGRATAHLFADEGAKVALIDINAEPLSKVVGEIHAEGLDAKGWTLDLSDAEAVGRVIKDVGDHFGGIDVLINNAGISLFAPIDAPDYFAAWDKSFAVMLTAQALTVRAALPYLRQAEHPRIINIASTEALGISTLLHGAGGESPERRREKDRRIHESIEASRFSCRARRRHTLLRH